MAGFRRSSFLQQPVVANQLHASATGTDLALSGTLVVTGASTLTGDVAAGNISMATGKRLAIDPGTIGAPSLYPVGSSGIGLYSAGADQLQFARGGANFAQITSGGFSVPTTFTASASTVLSSTLRLAAETVKTVNYQVTNTDAIVVMNGAGLTATLPAAGATSQVLWIKNNDGGTCTVARNGSTIDSAAADITLASKESCLLFYTGSEWFRLDNIP